MITSFRLFLSQSPQTISSSSEKSQRLFHDLSELPTPTTFALLDLFSMTIPLAHFAIAQTPKARCCVRAFIFVVFVCMLFPRKQVSLSPSLSLFTVRPSLSTQFKIAISYLNPSTWHSSPLHYVLHSTYHYLIDYIFCMYLFTVCLLTRL